MVLSCLFVPLRRIFTRVLPVPRTSESCTTFIYRTRNFFTILCSVRYMENHTRGIYPGISWLITSVSYVRPCHNTRGKGTAFSYLPGTSVSSVRRLYPYMDLLWVLYACATTPGVRVQPFYTVPGISLSSVRLCHNTWNFCGFCDISIPVPGASVSSVRLSYPYPESTNPTEHNLENLHPHRVNMWKFVTWCRCGKFATWCRCRLYMVVSMCEFVTSCRMWKVCNMKSMCQKL